MSNRGKRKGHEWCGFVYPEQQGTSNAIRSLSTFAGEKVIAIDGRKIHILDINCLEKISKQG